MIYDWETGSDWETKQGEGERESERESEKVDCICISFYSIFVLFYFMLVYAQGCGYVY